MGGVWDCTREAQEASKIYNHYFLKYYFGIKAVIEKRERQSPRILS